MSSPDFDSLRSLPAAELLATARALDIENPAGMKKQDLVAAILRENSSTIDAEGILEILPDGFGFLRYIGTSFITGADDIYVSPSQIRKFNLRTGDCVRGQVRAPKENERYFALIKVEAINEQSPEQSREKLHFDNLTPIWPRRHLRLEHRPDELCTRLIDLCFPLGFGQRSLIVGPPRSGRTTLLSAIARGITHNHPQAVTLLLLIGERPEEVTEVQRSVPVPVIAATADEPEARHVQVADILLERARRLVEQGRDVVLLVDSLTRLARASHACTAPSGRSLPGGLEPGAMQRVRALFGAARNVEEGGSLTVLAVAQAGTGARFDEAVVEELRGMENHMIVLDRGLAERRIFPAFDLGRSVGWREDLLLSPEPLSRLRAVRTVNSGDAAGPGVWLGRLSRYPTNAALLDELAPTGEKTTPQTTSE